MHPMRLKCMALCTWERGRYRTLVSVSAIIGRAERESERASAPRVHPAAVLADLGVIAE